MEGIVAVTAGTAFARRIEIDRDTRTRTIERYRAQLRREESNWRAQFENFLHSDDAAVTIGVTALRTAVLINAGAVVALLAFVGRLWGDPQQNEALQAVVSVMQPFVLGVVAGAVATGIAYVYQSLLTARVFRSLEEVSEGHENLKPSVWVPRFWRASAILMIFSAAVSYILFLWGAVGPLNAFRDAVF